MTGLMITDIRKSDYNSGFDLVTAIILSTENCEDAQLLSMVKKRCNSLLVLESSTAEDEIPAIGVRKGDQFIRMWASPDHKLKIGDEMQFDDTR